MATLRVGGFTLIELLVTIAVGVLLGLIAIPNLVSMMDSGKTSVLVNQFPQDVAWARNQAVAGQSTVSITLSDNGCNWATSVTAANGTVNPADAEHSMSSTQFAASYPGVSCSISGAPSSGVLAFDTQGFITDGAGGSPVSPTIVVTAARGQTWTLQVLASGTVLVNANTSS